MSLTSASSSSAGSPDNDAATSLPAALRAHRLGMVASAVFAVLGAACSLAPYLAVYAVTKALFIDHRPDQIDTIVLWAGLALLVRGVADAIANHTGHVAAYRSLRDLRLGLAQALQRMPLGRVQAHSSGELKKVLHDDVEQLEEAIAHGVPQCAAAAAVPVATTVALWLIDWRLALLALASLVALVVISAVGMVLAARNNKALASHDLVLHRAVMGYLQGIVVIRGYLRPDVGLGPATQAVNRHRELQDAATSGPLRWLVAVMGVATSLAVVFLVPGAGLGVVDGRVDLATLVLFGLLGLGYLAPVVRLVSTLATVLTRIQLSATAVTGLLAEPQLPTAAEPQQPASSEVRFDTVCFGYRDDQVTLDEVSLLVEPGTTLALVGPTGSGKSTIAKLLARFADPRSGTVSIGGVDVRQIDPQHLPHQVAFVQQDEYIFASSLLENIRLARPDASDDDVIQAARMAQLGDLAQAREQGWHRELAAGGPDLSGGQRQRIAVARALLKNSPIIVLDEATASLDSLTEQRTLAAIDTLTQGRTVISIAHRLSTIIGSDAIAMVEAGRITAHGTHEELLEHHRPYRELWQAYQNSEGWQLHTDDVSTTRSETEAPAPESTAHEPMTTKVATTPPEPIGSGDQLPAPTRVDTMSFGRQWRALYGRSWHELLTRGLAPMVLESLVRGAPLLAVLVLVLAALGVPIGGASGLDARRVWVLTGALCVALLLRVCLAAWANAVVWRLSAQAKADLQLSVLDRARRVPLGFFGKVDSGRLGSLVTSDIPMLDFQNLPQQVLGAVVQPVVAMVVLAVLDIRLALAALIGLPVFWLFLVLGDRAHRRSFDQVHRARQHATGTMLEQARGAAVLRGNPGSQIAQRYVRAMDELAEASIAMSVRSAPATTLGAMALESGQLAVIAVGAALHQAGAVSTTTLLIFLLVSMTLYQPLQELDAINAQRQNQQQVARRLAEVWDAPVLAEPARPAIPTGFDVDLDRVDFSYDKGEPALQQASLHAAQGQITALVGPSGSGKSTIARLIARGWDVEAGAVRIGGLDVRQIGSTGVLAAVTTVFQEVYLFEDTVRFNLTLGNPDASDEQVWDALRAAQAEDVVAGLPNGLDTILADGGADLSGGQRQRLAITRALLKDSPVLILDEAVAAVDPGTEDRIQRALNHLAIDRTVIVVAHRLATIEHAHQIVVVDQGRVVGAGTHDELLTACPLYHDLVKAQSAATTAPSQG